jgi:putative NADH-flavin reductase
MTRITVIGGTGYAGSAIVTEAAARGHEVTSFSRSLPSSALANVTYVLGDAANEEDLAGVINDAAIVVGAIAPRGSLVNAFRDVYGVIGRLSDAAGARLFIVGGFSSLRPAAGAPRFVTDLSHAPAELHHELTVAAALVADDLPGTPATLDWVFVSPAGGFGSHLPGDRLGRYRIGGEVAVQPDGGGAISGADYALGFVDAIEQGKYHRAHVNLGY